MEWLFNPAERIVGHQRTAVFDAHDGADGTPVHSNCDGAPNRCRPVHRFDRVTRQVEQQLLEQNAIGIHGWSVIRLDVEINFSFRRFWSHQ